MAYDFPDSPAFNATFNQYVWDGDKWRQAASAVNAFALGIGGFDGSTTYLTNTGVSGIADGKQGLLSFWIKVTGGAGTDRSLFYLTTGSTIRLWGHITTTNIFEIKGRSTASADVLIMQTTTPNPFTTATNWVHVAAWWDLSLATPIGEIYVNGTKLMSSTKTFANTNINYDRTTMNIGANNTPAAKMFGNLASFYLNLHETLDLSVTANLQKFRTLVGYPVLLGADGSTPTGTAPEFFLGGAHDSTNWGTNLGTKGNFTTPAGTLTDVGGPPT